MKKVAIVQSNYIPWRGYFDLIAAVDEFILYDDVQYTRRDWRNRNQIKTPQGPLWLTVPVMSKGRYDQKIRETMICKTNWAIDHWKSIQVNYRKAIYFEEIVEWLEPIYLIQPHTSLSQLNRTLIEAICRYLKINTKISSSSDYRLIDGKTERLAHLCRQTEANVYISGPAAKSYINEQEFLECGVSLEWFEYSRYLEYPQLWGTFVHRLSIIDLLFNCGKDATRYMRHAT